MTTGESQASSGKWDDLRARVLSSIGMVAVGIAGLTSGGVWFQMLAVFVTAIMVWELAMMINGEGNTRGMLLAALTASVVSGLLTTTQDVYYMGLLLIPAALGAIVMPQERLTFFFFTLAITVAGWGLVTFREVYGVTWLFWLVLVVVVTDVGGYFGGRIFGGPKFWPSVSPKKTWAGVLTGWAGAALLGAAFLTFTTAGRDLIWISAVISFSSQMGDIAESALKRRLGVKDSSTLIPGHGGLFDRFDGLLGAAILMLIVSQIVDVPVISL